MILVTGATGNVGRNVVTGLLERGEQVRALTRDPSSARLPGGVEVVGGDLAEPGGLGVALRGVDAVFLLWPTLSADHAAPATVEAIAERTGRIVYVSARGADGGRDPGTILGSHGRMEKLLRDTGGATFLRPGGFAANTRLWAPRIKATGTVRAAFGDMVRPLIHERDIAAVGVAVLTSDGHAGAAYELTGPEGISQRDQAAVIGAAIGRTVRWEELSPGAAREEMVAQGMPAALAKDIVSSQAAALGHPETVTSTVEEITGCPARSFRQWAADHAGDFR